MSQTDKTMELRNIAKEIAEEGHSGWGNVCTDAADYIEAMQRDCRTCESFSQLAYIGNHCTLSTLKIPCTNHDKYQPMLEFKQLTRSTP